MHDEWGPDLADAVVEQVETSIKYAGYIDKQRDEVERAAASYRLEAEQRRKLSPHDPAADALEYVSRDLLERAKTLADRNCAPAVPPAYPSHTLATALLTIAAHVGRGRA